MVVGALTTTRSLVEAGDLIVVGKVVVRRAMARKVVGEASTGRFDHSLLRVLLLLPLVVILHLGSAKANKRSTSQRRMCLLSQERALQGHLSSSGGST